MQVQDVAPPPTCIYDQKQIKEYGVLPLACASEFLGSITPFAGIIDHFNHPNFTLFYTLTRSINYDNLSEVHLSSNRVLYITILDYKEGTTRIYTQDTASSEHFYFTVNQVPDIDLQSHVLEIRIGSEIFDKNSDPVLSPDIQRMLKSHYKSIIDQLHRRLGNIKSQDYVVENQWTLKFKNTKIRKKG
ncbi:hypothetical protein BDQ17DRAFT_525720 [Cyathus striatus]|nr:hypothetical protein BDQ17DRAFT_525720 [Cyathus striatus]